jgi:hypothetical protein
MDISRKAYALASKKIRDVNMKYEKPYLQLGYSLKDRQKIYDQEKANYSIGKPPT